MGPASDPTAVVDASGHVHGLHGLLVADAAIMPSVTLANTNLPTFVGAEKIARDLLARDGQVTLRSRSSENTVRTDVPREPIPASGVRHGDERFHALLLVEPDGAGILRFTSSTIVL